jgi:hypothetical protein
MTMGQMTIGQMTIGQMTIGQMTLAKRHLPNDIGQMTIGQMTKSRDVLVHGVFKGGLRGRIHKTFFLHHLQSQMS